MKYFWIAFFCVVTAFYGYQWLHSESDGVIRMTGTAENLTFTFPMDGGKEGEVLFYDEECDCWKWGKVPITNLGECTKELSEIHRPMP